MTGSPELAKLFCQHYAHDGSATLELSDALVALWRRAIAGWTDAWLGRDEFIEQLASRMNEGPKLAERLALLQAQELYLAYACAAGHTEAVAIFESTYMPVVVSTVRGMRGQDASADEVAQQIRERLLVGTGQRGPRIADYSGRGDLRRWLRATATRTYLNVMRKNKREIASSDSPVMGALVDGDVGPELALMKETYRKEFKGAFEAALSKLSDRQKNVLRYRHVDGVTVEGMAKMYSIHRATAHRWINEARSVLAKATERELRKRLDIDESEFESIRRMIQSQVQLSLPRVLAADDD